MSLRQKLQSDLSETAVNQLVLEPVNRFAQQDYPHFIKYMGSKSKIMDFVIDGVNEVHDGGAVCDLFGGSGSLAGAIGRQVSMVSNDIQAYSAVIADTYLNAWLHPKMPAGEEIIARAECLVSQRCAQLPIKYDFSLSPSREEFVSIEKRHQLLIEQEFDDEWHLFIKNYSGTWWSAEQCAWIDAIRAVSEEYKEAPFFNVILSCLMYAMAYTSQGTGHYAQYRDAKTESALKDILIYRRRSLTRYFLRKYNDITAWLPKEPTNLNHRIMTSDFSECLESFGGGTIYADPPYCFVHYSRFYHALETLVLYDYPELQVKGGKVVKGRYRDDRHQSPFCIKSQVHEAFSELFEGVERSGSKLVLSYSNTGMITIDEIGDLVAKHLPKMKAEVLTIDHQHMTLGRQKDRHREVKECPILVK